MNSETMSHAAEVQGSMPSQHDSSPTRKQDSECLEAVENELTREVPSFLESMNNAASEVNELESEAAVTQQKYQILLADWTALAEHKRAKHGKHFDAVKPYFDAVQRARSASRRAQGIVRAFGAATSECTQATAELRKIEKSLSYGAHTVSLDWEQQEGLSKATVRACQCQQERDKCEREYSTVIKEYEQEKDAAETCAKSIGKFRIHGMMPCFRELQNSKVELDELRKQLAALEERIRVAKNTYHTSMRNLERISTAVHHARKEHKQKAMDSKQASKESGYPQPCPEQDHPPVEMPDSKLGEEFAFGDLSPSRSLSHIAEKRDGSGSLTPEVTGDDCPFS